ncbi:MAG: hypothetical protein ACRDAU_00670 [Clostridium sp.]
MTGSNQAILIYLLAIIIFVALIATITYFFIGLKSKNYTRAKIFGGIYLFSNILRLIFEHFELY